MPVYLFASLCLLGCLAAGWLLWPRQFGASILAGLALVPFSFLGAAFVPAYWQPDHVVTFVRGVGPEDVLFCFACGGLGWMTAAGWAGAHWTGLLPVRIASVRFGCWASISLLAAYLATRLGLSVLPSTVAGFALGGLLAACRAPRLLVLSVPGALAFTAAYVVVGWLVIDSYPVSRKFWTDESLCGHRVLGLPVEEVGWALAFGAIWPLVLGYCLGRELEFRRAGTGTPIPVPGDNL